MAIARLSRNTVAGEELTSAFCGGLGKYPFDIMPSLSTCCVCGGSGKVRGQASEVGCVLICTANRSSHVQCLDMLKKW